MIFQATREGFDVVPIHSPELGERLNQLAVSAQAKERFTTDMKHLCKNQQTK